MIDGMKTGGPYGYTDQDAPGAIPRGWPIIKVFSELGDTNPVGTKGKVIGSMTDGKVMGYFVEWETMPGVPVFVADFKIQKSLE